MYGFNNHSPVILAVAKGFTRLPPTSPALPAIWVGECVSSLPPTPTPRMLGRSCWRRTSHREGPASSSSFHRRFACSRPGRFLSLVRSASRSPLWGRTASSTECPQDTGGTGDSAGPGDYVGNRLNSVGQFRNAVSKLALQAAPYFARGHPGTPRRLREICGTHGFAARTFLLCSDQRACPLESQAPLKKIPGPIPGSFSVSHKNKLLKF